MKCKALASDEGQGSFAGQHHGVECLQLKGQDSIYKLCHPELVIPVAIEVLVGLGSTNMISMRLARKLPSLVQRIKLLDEKGCEGSSARGTFAPQLGYDALDAWRRPATNDSL